MNGPDTTTELPSRRSCLVDGCSCKDARIISQRRIAYFANQAKANGETADRIIPVDAGWRLPVDMDLDVECTNGAPR